MPTLTLPSLAFASAGSLPLPLRGRGATQAPSLFTVMAGLVPAIHVFPWEEKENVDARDKPGHDGAREIAGTSHCRIVAVWTFVARDFVDGVLDLSFSA